MGSLSPFFVEAVVAVLLPFALGAGVGVTEATSGLVDDFFDDFPVGACVGVAAEAVDLGCLAGDASAVVVVLLSVLVFLATGAGVGVAFAIFGSGVAEGGVGVAALTTGLGVGVAIGAGTTGAWEGSGAIRIKLGEPPPDGGPCIGLSKCGPARTGGATGG